VQKEGELVSSIPMAEIRPFRGLRYSESAGNLKMLVAPPYDVLSPAERENYAARSPYNIVHLTLPEQNADDRSKYVKYARSAATLAEWRRQEVLEPEDQPVFYKYTQTFKVLPFPDTLTRTSLIALLKVEPYDRGVVLPHEQTFPKHKEDRLRILEATRSHLECIFGLFEDDDRALYDLIANAPAGTEAHVDQAIGASHTLEPISDPETIQAIQRMMAEKKVWIADGHHRYETACTFREMQGEKSGPIPEDYMMMAFSSMSDPGLVLLPTHRVVHGLGLDRDQLSSKLSGKFNIEEVHSSQIPMRLDQAHHAGEMMFGVAIEGGHGLLLTPKDKAGLISGMSSEGSAALKSLDVTVLHRVILEELLGKQGLEGIDYTRNSREALLGADSGGAVSFLMNPPSVDDMRTIALGGEKMPQKSTYYFPKILSGIVLWSLGDFDA
jgi:uncharacterized protein (DUF1015 family)